MKISVSLPEEDVVYLDNYASSRGLPSRSAALQHAIGILRRSELDDDYSAAFEEWADSEDARLWDTTLADGISGASR